MQGGQDWGAGRGLPEALTRAAPPPPQVLREMCKQGYRDGLRFLRRNGAWPAGGGGLCAQPLS